MAAQKITEARRLLAEAMQYERQLRDCLNGLERQITVMPSSSCQNAEWEVIYLLDLFATARKNKGVNAPLIKHSNFQILVKWRDRNR